MSDSANNQDVPKQEAVAPVEAVETTSSPAVPKEPEVGSKEYNFRQMEQRNRQLERELWDLQAKVQQVALPKVEEKDEFAGLQPDELITYGQVSKITEKLAAQKAAQIVQQEFERREKEQLPQKVRSEYKDYDQVVTEDNIQQLIKEDPDLEHDIQISKNPYARAYKEIKKSNFYQSKNVNREGQQKLEENAKKPVSSNAVGTMRPLSQMASRSREDLLAEMDKCRGGFL